MKNENLDEIFDITEEVTTEIVEVDETTPEIEGRAEEVTTDYQYTRSNYYDLIEKGTSAIESSLQIAQEGQHPRAYEVVGQLVDKLTNANKELMGLHKTKKSMSDEVVRSPQNVTNALFVGSTADLQKMLKQKSKEA